VCARALREESPQMADDVIYTEPVFTERHAIATRADDQETDWSGWENWLRGHLNIEKQSILDAVVDAVGDLEAKRDRQIRELELKIAECSGAVRVLRTGKSLRVRGTFSEDAKYEYLDIVAIDGSSFVATEDAPGPCPGKGWQLLAKAGSRGARGFIGPRGERGERGDSATAPGIEMLHLDSKDYTLSLILETGKIHSVSLRGLFEQFLRDVQGERAP
jgi:hypothetical protein